MKKKNRRNQIGQKFVKHVLVLERKKKKYMEMQMQIKTEMHFDTF